MKKIICNVKNSQDSIRNRGLARPTGSGSGSGSGSHLYRTNESGTVLGSGLKKLNGSRTQTQAQPIAISTNSYI